MVSVEAACFPLQGHHSGTLCLLSTLTLSPYLIPLHLAVPLWVVDCDLLLPWDVTLPDRETLICM